MQFDTLRVGIVCKEDVEYLYTRRRNFFGITEVLTRDGDWIEKLEGAMLPYEDLPVVNCDRLYTNDLELGGYYIDLVEIVHEDMHDVRMEQL